MKLITGLGNPGDRYKLTRHNIGFLVLDYISKQENLSFDKKKKYKICSFNKLQDKIFLLKPYTYMNLSGTAVRSVSDFYKIEPNNIIVIHDDIDLNFGEIRIKKNGGAGGHNGLKSIISELNTNSFFRIRIGIKTDVHEDYDLSDYVLSKFSAKELNVLDKIFETVYDILFSYFLKNEISDAMQKYNKRNLLES